MVSKAPWMALGNGLKCPILGLGTWQSKPNEVGKAVSEAIDIGYRHFDCSPYYGNEKEIGIALNEKMKDSVERKDLFITSKLWNDCHDKKLVEPALRSTLKNLCLSYLDLYLIHWPMGIKDGDDPKKKVYTDTHFTDTWKCMEDCLKKGLVKSIGVSNFNSEQVKQVVDMAEIMPVMNQVECHIHLNQEKLLNFCKCLNVSLTAYSPLGAPGSRVYNVRDELLKDPTVICLSEKYCKTPAQILIRFQIERGIFVIPKSSNSERLLSNFDVFNFEISQEDMKLLMSLNKNARIVTLSKYSDHKDYPFNIEF